MAKLSSLTSSNLADLQMAVLMVLSLVAMVYTKACSTLTQFTMYNPQLSDVTTITCKNCSTCPPGQGLPKDCGDKVPYGTPTDCVPCKPNQTYSKNNDSSTCKTCRACEQRIVLQECTLKQDRKCGGCLEGHYLERHLDVCKECHFCCPGVPESQHLQQCKNLGMPRDQQCEDTEENKKCKIQAEKAATSQATFQTRWNSSTRKIRATTSTTDIHKKTHSVNRIQTTTTSRTAETDEDSKSHIFIGVSVGVILIIILLFPYIWWLSRHRQSSGDQDSGRTTPSQPSQNPSTASSCTSSVENICDRHKEWLTKNIQCIPKDQGLVDLPYEVEKSIKKLDCLSIGVHNWRDLGRKFEIPEADLNQIALAYQSGGSPVKTLMEKLHTKYMTPLQTFVSVVQEIEREDIADEICSFYKSRVLIAIQTHPDSNSTMESFV